MAYFFREPVASWRWYLERFSVVEGKRPNPAHLALAALERWQLVRGGEFLLVTQNVDCLHEAAGSRALVKVHGSADRVRCSAVGCENGAPWGSLPRADIDQAAFLADPSEATLPRCPACGEILRQHLLWFDEYYDGHRDYQFARVKRAAESAGVVLFAGTSFAVGVTEAIVDIARSRGAAIFSIDPANRSPHPRVTGVAQPAEEVLPRLCAALGAPLADG